MTTLTTVPDSLAVQGVTRAWDLPARSRTILLRPMAGVPAELVRAPWPRFWLLEVRMPLPREQLRAARMCVAATPVDQDAQLDPSADVYAHANTGYRDGVVCFGYNAVVMLRKGLIEPDEAYLSTVFTDSGIVPHRLRLDVLLLGVSAWLEAHKRGLGHCAHVQRK